MAGYKIANQSVLNIKAPNQTKGGHKGSTVKRGEDLRTKKG